MLSYNLINVYISWKKGGVFLAAIDSAYHYYLSTYGTSKVSRYDTHKKSQLRAVYNQIVKTNKDTPLYKIPDSTDVKKFAIDLKEHTRLIQNVIAALSDNDEGIENVFNKKVAKSSDESSVNVTYIGEDQSLDNSLHFDVEVKQLAAPQINVGKFLYPDECDFKTGTYTFDISTDLSSYEFQYTVSRNDDNQHILEKLARLVNSSGAGTGATVGKLLGFGNAMKSGAGYHEISLPGGLRVGAYVVVNACGEVFDGEKIFAGVFSRSRKKIISSHELMLSGITREFSGANTTIACVITNAALSKAECSIVSGMAHDGYARSIRPVHTTMDGDAIFTMASGEYETAVDTVGYLAEDAIRLAVIDAIKNTETMGGCISYNDIFSG